MGTLYQYFKSKEELAEWLVINVRERYDQEELMFEGLKNLQDHGKLYIKSRIIYFKLSETVLDENGDPLYLYDFDKTVKYKKGSSESIKSYYMPLWKWIKLQTPLPPPIDPDEADI